MARQVQTPAALPGPFAGTAVAFAFVAGDVANGDEFSHTGREIILADNTGASPYNVTITNVDCTHGRAGTTVIAVPAGEKRAFPLYPRAGFSQSGGLLFVNVENASVEIAVLRLPQ